MTIFLGQILYRIELLTLWTSNFNFVSKKWANSFFLNFFDSVDIFTGFLKNPILYGRFYLLAHSAGKKAVLLDISFKHNLNT
jgi:hypothetical protein